MLLPGCAVSRLNGHIRLLLRHIPLLRLTVCLLGISLRLAVSRLGLNISLLRLIVYRLGLGISLLCGFVSLLWLGILLMMGCRSRLRSIGGGIILCGIFFLYAVKKTVVGSEKVFQSPGKITKSHAFLQKSRIFVSG